MVNWKYFFDGLVAANNYKVLFNSYVITPKTKTKDGSPLSFHVPMSKDLLDTLEISKIDTIDNPREEFEHIIVVKNKTDKNVLIKVRGFDKELLVEEAMKKCTDKHKEGCYVHYSSTVRYGQ